MLTRVAALFVDPSGPYPKMEGVDVWDNRPDRDARLYPGPFPVVAHPPCHLWTNLAAVNFKRYGGEHNRPGNDLGCFMSALMSVRAWGGVLEHPAFSRAWKEHGLRRPEVGLWTGGSVMGPRYEWVCEVWQSAYGHKARKRTWLLYVGTPLPHPARWERPPGTHQIGWYDRIKPTLGKREASRTPLAFAEYLVALARSAWVPYQ